MSGVRIGRPGAGVQLIADPDPYNGLTQRQRHILEVVRAFNGNRSRAAAQLGITEQAVGSVLRYCERAGAPVPPSPGRGSDHAPRTRRWGRRPNSDGPPLTEADLFAARTIGVRERE